MNSRKEDEWRKANDKRIKSGQGQKREKGKRKSSDVNEIRKEMKRCVYIEDKTARGKD